MNGSSLEVSGEGMRVEERQMLIAQIMALMQEVGHHSRQAVTVRMANSGLSLAHWMVLHMLGESNDPSHAQPTMRRLADILGMPPSSMTGVVDALEKRQFIERTPDHGDRRVTRLQMTPQGMIFVDDLRQWMIEDYIQALSTLDHEELLMAYKTFSELIRHYRRPIDPPSLDQDVVSQMKGG
jgi:DNA-binding MarR family transcriptional regulator